MVKSNIFSWSVLVLATLAACSGGGCPDQASCSPADLPARVDRWGPADLRPSEGASLRVESYYYLTQLIGTQAAAGRQFVVVRFVLSNESEATPLSLAARLFSLESDRALVYVADSGLSGSVSRPCGLNTAVALGGVAACEMAFDLPVAEQSKQLLYTRTGPPTSLLTAPCPVQPSCPEPAAGRYGLAQPGRLVQIGCNITDSRIFFAGGITLAEIGRTGSEVTLRVQADATTKLDLGKGSLGCPTPVLAQEDVVIPPPVACTVAQERQTTVEARPDGLLFTKVTLKDTLKAGSCLAQPTCTTVWEVLWRKQ